jgi:LacI family transcriptional regulator
MGSDVSLDDVARVSGVSPAAASRALNGRTGVRPDVRERVMLVAESLGYRPNRAARNLASGRSSVIGLVVPSLELRLDSYGASILQSVAHAASENDQGLMLVLGHDEPGKSVRHILRDGLIDGVVVSTVAFGEKWVEELIDSDIPTQLIGFHPDRRNAGSVDVENLESAAIAVEHLLDQGCRRIATLTGPLDRLDAQDRFAGFRLAHERRGLKVRDNLIASGDFSRASGAAAIEDLVNRKFDGLFVANDEMALGAMQVLSAKGIAVPDDVLVVGFDGTSALQMVHPTLTSMHQPFEDIAGRAVTNLLARIDGDTPDAVRLSATLVVGESSTPGSSGSLQAPRRAPSR